MENLSSKSTKSRKKVRVKVAKKKQDKVIDVRLAARSSKNKPATAAAKAAAVKSASAKLPRRSSEPTPIKKAAARRAAVEAAPAETPAFLQTPSTEMLRSFREAGKRSRDLARKVERSRGGSAQFLAKQAKTGKRYAIDLRIHSPATAGYFSTGGVETGPAIVRLARVKGLDAIAVTDYYHAGALDAVQASASKTKLAVIPGFDICCAVGTCREVYLTALFAESTTSGDLFQVLEALQVPAEMYGRRDYCMELPLGEIIEIIESRGGALIPSRLDKTPYRQLALPALVEEYGFHAFDLVHPENTEFFKERWPAGGFTFFSFSNANALAQIGSRSANVRLKSCGFEGIKALVERRRS